MKLRVVLFWCHLVAGVVAGAIILVMSATGALLAFERQIVDFAERDARRLPATSTGPRLAPRALLESAAAARPDARPSALTLSSDAGEPATVALGRERALFLDPFTGAVLGESDARVRGFFHAVTDWHRWLGTEGAGRATGRALTGACNLAFAVIVPTGLFLWWPRAWSRKHLRSITLFASGLSGRARDFNWHNVLGLWSAPVLLILSLTGVVMSYPWANDLLYTLTGSTPPPRPAGPGGGGPPGSGGAPGGAGPSAGGADRGRERRGSGERRGGPEAREGREGREERALAPELLASVDRLWARAEQQAPGWRVITQRLAPGGGGATFTIEDGTSWNPFARSQLTLDARTAEVAKWEPYAQASLGRRLRVWVRGAHTGEAFGIVGQALAGAASLAGVVLVWTGLALAWRRLVAWRGRRRAATVRVPAAEAALASPGEAGEPGPA